MKSKYAALFVAFLVLCLVSCNKDDDSGTSKNPNPPAATGDHTYSFTVTGGPLNGETFSGVIANEFLAAVSFSSENSQSITVTSGEDETQGTTFALSINLLNNIIQPMDIQSEGSHSLITLHLPDENGNNSYLSTSGTISMSNLVVGTGFGVSYASFDAVFDGTFKNFSTEESVGISGTFSIKQPVE